MCLLSSSSSFHSEGCYRLPQVKKCFIRKLKINIIIIISEISFVSHRTREKSLSKCDS